MSMNDLIATAQKAQISWSANPIARSAALSAVAKSFITHRDQMVDLMVDEVYKPITEARGEFARAVAILEYFSQAVLDPDGTSIPTIDPNLILSIRRPYGVAGLITPWNFPLAIPLWKAAPALAVGNAVIIKPSEFATKTALFLQELMNKTLPQGIFNVLPGGSEVGAELVDSADLISFTGSAKVGRGIVARAAALGKPVQAEMGGHSPAIVLPDADLELLASHIQIGAFSYSGQKCTATRRIIIVGNERRKAEVIESLVAGAEKLIAGDPRDEKTFLGPLIHSDSYKNYCAAVASAKEVGSVISGGRLDETGGNLPSATLTDSIPPEHQLMCEEVFAPITHISSVSTTDEAIALANAVRYGLTASIHTSDLEASLRISKRLETGMVKVNGPTAGVDFHAPFGGDKDSSYGMREQGKASLDFYTHTQTITVNSGTRKFQ
jgi:aldehyde dehydrogenase (NAD+)